MTRKPVDLEAIRYEYEVLGWSPNTIAKRHGVHGETIRHRLIELGVKLRNQPSAQALRYAHGKGDIKGLARDLGMPPSKLRALLARHGFLSNEPSIPTRPRQAKEPPSVEPPHRPAGEAPTL